MLTKDIIGIQLNSCKNVEITGCYFENFRTGVYAVTCTGGINIHCNSFKNIAGAKPRGQIVQFNKCYGEGNRVNYNILDHTFGSGNPEDLINMYGSFGTTTDPIQIIGNKLRGGGPSTSGGGIMIGDDGGHDIRVEDNILVDVGQYGIGSPAGYNMTIINNKIYGAQKTWSNVGLYVGLQGEINAGFDCLGNTIQVKNNQVKFYRKDGVLSGWYNCPCCPGVVQSGNNFNASITASILPTVLQLDANHCPVPISPINQIISLQKGWNIISINVRPTDSTIATLFKNIDVQEIKSETTFWRKGQISAFNSLTKITSGAAYLVNINVSTTLTVSGSPIETQTYASLPSSGWNMIGCYEQTAVSISKYFTSTNCKIIKNLDGFWIPGGSKNSITTLEPGKGYFIKK